MIRDKQNNLSEEKPKQAKSKIEMEERVWNPKTELGKKVKSGDIADIEDILSSSGKRILEPEIVDALLPDLEEDFIKIGQAKGKFGGGKRRIFRQTQKKTREGNKPIFSVMSVVGNKNGYVGYGIGKSKETLPTREKAVRNAKLNLISIARGCGSWECTCRTPHSIPFEVKGKCGSVEVKLMPAPKGTGLAVDDELKIIMRLAGIRDIWCKTKGQSRQTSNFVKACFQALRKTVTMRMKDKDISMRYGASG